MAAGFVKLSWHKEKKVKVLCKLDSRKVAASPGGNSSFIIHSSLPSHHFHSIQKNHFQYQTTSASQPTWGCQIDLWFWKELNCWWKSFYQNSFSADFWLAMCCIFCSGQSSEWITRQQKRQFDFLSFACNKMWAGKFINSCWIKSVCRRGFHFLCWASPYHHLITGTRDLGPSGGGIGSGDSEAFYCTFCGAFNWNLMQEHQQRKCFSFLFLGESAAWPFFVLKVNSTRIIILTGNWRKAFRFVSVKNTTTWFSCCEWGNSNSQICSIPNISQI